MRRRLHIAADDSLSFGSDYVTKAVAILAQRRKGKTYTASVIAEEMCKAGIPWVAIDPTGAWWGLRSKYPVIVLGGDNGDVPLDRSAGALVADLVVDNPGFYIIDLSHFESRAAEREFTTAFAERFYRRKHQNKTPMHLFVDEADLFIPQERRDQGDNRMLGAFESIVKRGGIRGIGVTCITQRSASLNKHVLEQCDLYIILRTVGPNDQTAIEKTVKARGTPEEKAELMGSLASLGRGEAWAWEPGGDPPLFQRVQVRERETFNSSATPEAGEQPLKPKQMADVDLAALEQQMAAAVEKKKQEDPAELRKQIKQLKLELQQERAKVPEPAEPEELEVEVPVVPEGLEGKLKEAASAASQAVGLAEEAESAAEAGLDILSEVEKAPKTAKPAAKPRAVSRDVSTNAPTTAPKPAQSSADPEDDLNLLKGERKMLAVLCQQHPNRLSRAQLGTLAGFKPSGGTYRNYLNTLKRNGLVVEQDKMLEPTQAAFDHLGENIPAIPTTLEGRVAFWSERLLAGERLMLQTLVDHTDGLTREELAEITDFTVTGGTFRNYINTLKRNGLAEEEGGVLRAGHALFM